MNKSQKSAKDPKKKIVFNFYQNTHFDKHFATENVRYR